MLMSQSGALVRTPVKDISVVGRNTQGVRLIRLEEGDQLSGLERIDGLSGRCDAADGEAADGAMAPERRGGIRRLRPATRKPGVRDAPLQFLSRTGRAAASRCWSRHARSCSTGTAAACR